MKYTINQIKLAIGHMCEDDISKQYVGYEHEHIKQIVEVDGRQIYRKDSKGNRAWISITDVKSCPFIDEHPIFRLIV